MSDEENSESNVCYDAAQKIDFRIMDNGILMRAAVEYQQNHECSDALKCIFEIRKQAEEIAKTCPDAVIKMAKTKKECKP